MRLKITLQYNGYGLFGWQHQSGLATVEGHLLTAWTNLTGEAAPDIVAAGRTDAGVHGLGQVVHLDTAWSHAATPVKVMDGLNHYLPEAVRIVRVAVVEDAFHARFMATARHYRYVLLYSRILRPDWLGRAGHALRHHDDPPLNIDAMRAALHHLPLGESDFSGFRDAECASHTPVCQLLARDIDAMDDGFIHIRISANRFLHHMVRNIVGTLIPIGRGDKPVTELARVLASRDRRQAGVTFSPNGLYLLGVDYPPHTEHAVAGGDLFPTVGALGKLC